MDIENDQNPFEEKRRTIEKWKTFAIVDIGETESIVKSANKLVKYGIKTKDALHVSSAIAGKADYFITTDDKLIKKLSGISEIKSGNPVDIVGEIDEHDH